ncbi:MAG: hypothetical protein AAF304_04530 [Pseudomonadota bacterium]
MSFSKLILCAAFTSLLTSCGATRWHSIQEIPAEPTAYIRDSVFVSGDYIRNATIDEIDGNPIDRTSRNVAEIDLGVRKIKILCDEARGEFSSSDLVGQAKTLTIEAKIQRTYIVRCLPYTHWWIEDAENRSVVAGEKPTNI